MKTNTGISGSELPVQLKKIYNEAMPQKGTNSPNNSIQDSPFSVTISLPQAILSSQVVTPKSKTVLWTLPLSDFGKDKLSVTLEKIILEYGGCTAGFEVTELMKKILASDLCDFYEGLSLKADDNGMVTVHAVLLELSPADRYNSQMRLLFSQTLTSEEISMKGILRDIRGRALFRQYELLLDCVLERYEIIKDNANYRDPANELILEILSQMVSFVQRGYEGDHDDPISAAIYDLELSDEDTKGEDILNRLDGEKVEHLPTIHDLAKLEKKANLFIGTTADKDERFHFFPAPKTSKWHVFS